MSDAGAAPGCWPVSFAGGQRPGRRRSRASRPPRQSQERIGRRLYLKSLTLRGFKSFASSTTLRFEPGITAVVGPNGSGKSNVVDALAWVMGEQGAKSLRGGKMEDVIFAGTSSRPPLGRAEVLLTIDNTDGALPIDYTEVTISRLMFRSGQSEYSINGDSCRLLDVQELLSDSGIGREMHVIIGQGQLDRGPALRARRGAARSSRRRRASSSTASARRRRCASWTRCRPTSTRVQDLTGELRRQLKPLGRQAEIARRAAVIQSDLRDARLRLLADDLVTLRTQARSRRPPTRRPYASGAPPSSRPSRAPRQRETALEAEAGRAGAAAGRRSRRPGSGCPPSRSGCAASASVAAERHRHAAEARRRSAAAATPRTWSARPPRYASRRRCSRERLEDAARRCSPRPSRAHRRRDRAARARNAACRTPRAPPPTAARAWPGCAAGSRRCAARRRPPRRRSAGSPRPAPRPSERAAAGRGRVRLGRTPRSTEDPELAAEHERAQEVLDQAKAAVEARPIRGRPAPRRRRTRGPRRASAPPAAPTRPRRRTSPRSRPASRPSN